jgi:mRNA-degrading endonuclease RelE of RelBE toxin-antitoxin system
MIEPPVADRVARKRRKPMSSVKIRIGTHRVVVTICSSDGTVVVVIPKLA